MAAVSQIQCVLGPVKQVPKTLSIAVIDQDMISGLTGTVTGIKNVTWPGPGPGPGQLKIANPGTGIPGTGNPGRLLVHC